MTGARMAVVLREVERSGEADRELSDGGDDVGKARV